MKKRMIIASCVACTVIGLAVTMVVIVQANSFLRPSDVREASSASYVDTQVAKSKNVMIEGTEKTLEYDSSVDRNGKKDLYLDEERNKYYYNEKGELESYLQIWPDANPQKTEAAVEPDEPSNALKEQSGSHAEAAPEADPYAMKIPKEKLETMTEDELRIAAQAWKKGLELYGDTVADYELNSCMISTGTGNQSDIYFAKKYGADHSIYGQFFVISFDWYGTLKMATLYPDDFSDVDPADLSGYTEEKLFKMAHERLLSDETMNETVKGHTYELKASRLRRKEDGKVYLMVGICSNTSFCYTTYFAI